MLLPPLPPEATRGGVEPQVQISGSRWCEHFDSVEALARRLLALEQGLDQEVAKEDLPPDKRQRMIEDAAFGKRDLVALDTLRRDDLRYHRGGKHGGLLLRVQGPRDGEPRRYDQHAVVLRALRAISPAVPPGGASGVGGEGFEIGQDSPILVERQVVEAVVGAMLRRPLVLLAGVSGSGKTQLAKRLGKAWAAGLFHGRGKADAQPFAPAQKRSIVQIMSAFEQVGFVKPAGAKALDQWLLVHELTEPAGVGDRPAVWRGRYAFTVVKSDWTEASHLWGYHVPLPAEAEGFYATSTLRVFLRAHKAWHARTDKDKEAVIPHFVLLDEMNLSRPEHFASDLLSAMEVQLGSEGQSAAVIELHRAGAEVALRGDAPGEQEGVPARIGWAPGVCVIGTVNVDETTFSFAPKVLDRAALLEFTDINLDVMFEGKRYKGGIYDDVYAKHRDRFEALQRVLMPHNLHLAYRAAEEILAALSGAGERANEEWDHQICHKVLPRVRGPRASVEELLIALRSDKQLCDVQLSNGDRDNLERGKLPDYLEASVDRRGWARRSVKKIDQMLMRAWTTGFTSYFG